MVDGLEHHGWDSLWLSERVGANQFDPVGALCFAAGRTERIKLGTTVLILGYRPPCAPAGVGALHYQFKLYALDTMLSLPSTATREDVLNAMDGHIIGTSSYYSWLERTPDAK